MKLIVGLGNTGEKYEKTRHNLGFMVVEQFLKNFERVEQTAWQKEPKFKSDVALIEWQPLHGKLEKVVLAKPLTFMNESGRAVSLLAEYYTIKPADIWVVHDDIDLRVGSLRIRSGGSGGGHHGIESIIEQLGDEKFWRFRVGVGHPHEKVAGREVKYTQKHVDEFVLSSFNHDDLGKIRQTIKHTAKALGDALEHGLDHAMNQYNTK